MLENMAQQEFVRLRDGGRDFEIRLQERGERILSERREEMAQLQARADADGEDYVQSISDQVYRLAGILEEQRAAREQYGERIRNSLEAEFQKVEEAIAALRQAHTDATRTMERMVQDVYSRLGGEIQQERSQREVVQNRLLGLLEDTCGRLEASLTYGSGTPVRRVL